MVQNPSEFRRVLLEQFSRSPLTVGGNQVDGATVEEAIEEIVASMVRVYLQKGEPSACEKIVGAFFISLIERDQNHL